MQPEIILVGGGGHCKACIDVLETSKKFRIAGIVDVKEKIGQRVLGYKIIAADEDFDSLSLHYRNFLVTVGQIKDPGKRIEIFYNLKNFEVVLPVIISPFANVSKYSQINEGTIVMHQAIISPGAVIGKNCIINTKALVEHDAHIGDHCHVSTGAVLNGNVSIGNRTFIGSMSVVRENVNIGEKCIIGAGQKVLRDVEDFAVLTKD